MKVCQLKKRVPGCLIAFAALTSHLRRANRMNFNSLVLRRAIATGLSMLALATMVGPAKANLVLNGDFQLNSYPGSPTSETIVNIPGQITYWTVSGYGSTSSSWNAVYINDPNPNFSNPSSSPPDFMPAAYRSCTAAAGFQTGASCQNPNGPGWFVNLDGDPSFPAAISQPISGLTKGAEYQLAFSWSIVQRNDESGSTWGEYLEASLGDQSSLTPNIFPGPGTSCPTGCLPPQGFSGWFTTSLDVVWDGSSSLLSFMAHGNPSGLPPSVNLDSVSLTAVPEPSSWLMLIGGLGLVAVIARRRRQRVAAA